MIKTKNLNITDQIKTNYRDFALYTLMHRGIPNFEDALTNVQRMIILNAPTSFTKTMTVVGNVIADGYHHGDASLSKATSKLARPFGCSAQILDGSGFFGNSVNPEASSPRYTSVKLNKLVSEYVSKYKHLNEKTTDGVYLPLNLELPIGLFTSIIGISVGYKSTILPRKPIDILNFLNGKNKSITPYIQGFVGKVSKYQEMDNSWLFEGVCEINEKNKVITITSLPPLMSYKSFILKLNRILENKKVKIDNFTKDNVHIRIYFDNKFDLDSSKEQILNITKQIVREGIVFVKEDKVLEYDSIENYLIDFRRHRVQVEVKNCNYQINHYKNEIAFLEAKKEFMIFLKTVKDFYSRDKIEEFLKKYSPEINERLSRLQLKSLNKNEIDNIPIKVNEYHKLISTYSNTHNKNLLLLEELGTAYHTKKYVSEDYSDDEFNEIEIYKPNEEVDGDIIED